MKKILIAGIRLYKMAISPFTIRSCRYMPTCSDYAKEAIERFGPVKGSLMAFYRILRCNPFTKGGYDPVIKER